jgi:nucleotidyltransferase/DNA polymerase involved in DNA repair
MKKSIDERELADFRSVGPATLADFRLLGITSTAQLRRADADRLFAKLCRTTGKAYDPCVRDVFAAAIAQAKDPHLPEEQRDWWYWSRLRKRGQSQSG